MVLVSQNSFSPSLSTGKRCRCCVILMGFFSSKTQQKIMGKETGKVGNSSSWISIPISEQVEQMMERKVLIPEPACSKRFVLCFPCFSAQKGRKRMKTWLEKRGQAQEGFQAHSQRMKGEKENREEPAALFPRFLWEHLQWVGRPEECHKVWNAPAPCFLKAMSSFGKALE